MRLDQVYGAFPDRQACIDYLEEIRWSGVPRCAHCKSKRVGRISAEGTSREGRFNCYDCRNTFSVITGTIFHKTKIPLQKWFLALRSILNAKKGISSCQLARELELGATAAWYLMVRLRREMERQDGDSELLHGIVEADETWIGGKPKGKRKVTDPPKRPTQKMVLAGAIEREGRGRVKVKLLPGKHEPRSESLRPLVQGFIHEVVDTKKSTLMTDGFDAYQKLAEIMPHYSIAKGGEFDQERDETEEGDRICTNQIEGFWVTLKRAWYGTHHWYSEKYAPLYIAEACYKFNRRRWADPFGAFMARCFT